MTVEDWILEEIAKARDACYGIGPEYIFVMITSDNLKRLEKYRRFFGGTVDPTVQTFNRSIYANIEARGAYMWVLRDEEAYRFCRKIDLLLARHDIYRFDFCQKCRLWYMGNEDNQHRQA